MSRVPPPCSSNCEDPAARGHILYVVDGELDTELKDGRSFRLTAGMSYQVSDLGDASHRSSTRTGAKLFIVD
jgi:hypothetical protein